MGGEERREGGEEREVMGGEEGKREVLGGEEGKRGR